MRHEYRKKTIYQVLSEITHVGTWEWSVQTGKTLFNERWAEIIGYTLEELAPISIETWLNLAHPDDIKTAEIMLQKHFLGELDYYDNECRMKHKNGSWVWVHDRGKVVEWTPDGRPLRMYGTHGDITERKQVEDKINTSQKLLQRIIDLLPVRVFWKDNNLRFLGCNEILVKDAGVNSPEDLIGKDDFQMSWKEQAEMYQEDDKSVMNSGKSRLNIEELQTTPKGDKIWLKTSKVPLTDLQGNTIGLLGIYEDITERKQAEQEKKNNEIQLRQSQKMEAIGTLAGGIAHDFNNILGSIIGYAELVKDDISEGTIAYQNQKEVLIAAKRAKELVKQILTFSRKDEAKLVPVKINSIVADSLKMLRSSLPTTIEISHDINCTNSIMANETHIHQVLMNLCVNASHAMEDNGGILQISLSDVNIDLDTMTSDGNLKQGSYVKLLVKDTGSGMSREVQNRIFEPFFTTKEVGKGTGMGLSVVHGIVENHNGIITVDSKPGEGTTFEIFFPCVVDIEIKENEDSEIAFGNRERILLVDDQKNLVDMATQMLTRMGYEVVGKTDSVEALCIFREDPSKFDLVITDQIMPKMKGTELAKEILNIRPEIPIVLCTGYCENIDSEVIDAIGIKMLVMKPVDRIKISRIIREILDKNMIRKGQQYETHSCYR